MSRLYTRTGLSDNVSFLYGLYCKEITRGFCSCGYMGIKLNLT